MFGWYSLGLNWNDLWWVFQCSVSLQIRSFLGLQVDYNFVYPLSKKRFACICFMPITCNAGLKYCCVNDKTRREFGEKFWNLAALLAGDLILLILFLFLQINMKVESRLENLALHLCDTYFMCCAVVHTWFAMVFLLCGLKFSTLNFHYKHSH